MVSSDVEFFRRLERKQAPEYLWIGFSDSNVSANEIVGLGPGELMTYNPRFRTFDTFASQPDRTSTS
jgi:carbonic anhydrase